MKKSLMLKKYMPDILLALGITGFTTATVLACRKSKKVYDTVELGKELSSETEDKKEKRDIWIGVAKKVTVDLAIPVALGAASIGAILVSHRQLKVRNLELASAYSALHTSYERYREKVNGYISNLPEGERVTEKAEESESQNYPISFQRSEFAKYFDEASRYYDPDPAMNLKTLKDIQRYCNEKLKSRGYLFLNDVYQMLDIPKTAAGQFMGWLWDERHQEEIDFGIFDPNNERARAFVNGSESVIILDFNVTGNILDEFEKKGKY